MNITKKFANWSDFLDYVKELRDFLYKNDYIDDGREKIMQDETTFVEDLKKKGFYEKYLEFWNNCKNYIDENIVVYNSLPNKRYKDFDYSFRFSFQPWANDYRVNSPAYERKSVFVWDLIQYRSSPWYHCAYRVVHPIIFSLPVNEDYFELGPCWYSKCDYSIEDIENKRIKEYTTEEELKNFIESMCVAFQTKEGLPKLAYVDIETRQDNSCCSGPKSSWEVGIGGFKLEKIDNEDSYEVTIGVEKKTNVMVSMFSDAVRYENQPKQIAKDDMFDKIVEAIKRLNLDETKVKSITWYNKEGKTHIINRNGEVAIYCYHKGLDKEFRSLRGGLTSEHPYDPAYWGWT